jgi:3-hydroxybutyryl-CoA dehydrogenase
MRTGILASEDRKADWLKMAGDDFPCTWVQDTQTTKNFDLFIDLNFDQYPNRIKEYAGNTQTVFLLSAVNTTPEQAFLKENLTYSGEKIFGINALPTFLERPKLEATNPFNLNPNLLEDTHLPAKTEWVKSRVGMVTPRIVFMIINEAYFTLQEGTAEKEDINTAMKLGTNYPKGPFEWCQAVGIENVYLTLKAIFEDTGDERYKICPALQTEYIQSKIQA